MSRIKTTTLLKLEDFGEEQKKWIGKLISPINDFFTQCINIVNDGMVFPDNFIGKDFLYKFTYQSDALTLPQKFFWPLKVKPNALVVVSATENGVPIIAAVSWGFTTDGLVALTQVVKIDSTGVSALTAGSRYEIRARVTP